MKAESELIDDNELLYRRVHRDRFRSEKIPYLSPTAFEPRATGKDPDTDGISFFRASCIREAAEILALITDDEKRRANGIVAVKAGDIRKLGLSISITPRTDIAGHVSIPEMSALAISDKKLKQQCKDWMDKLAIIASDESCIVLLPDNVNPR